MSETTLFEALEEVLAGKHITRKSWDDKRSYVFLKDSLLQIHKAGVKKDKASPWIISDVDLLGEDWYVL